MHRQYVGVNISIRPTLLFRPGAVLEENIWSNAPQTTEVPQTEGPKAPSCERRRWENRGAEGTV